MRSSAEPHLKVLMTQSSWVKMTAHNWRTRLKLFLAVKGMLLGPLLAWISRTRAEPLINTGALARWKDALWLGELFQQFVNNLGKPLKRLRPSSVPLHRAKAPVLMRFCWYACEISGIGLAAVSIAFAAREMIRPKP